MPTYVPDTHSLLWLATGSPRLGVQANAIFSQVDQGNARLLIPIMVIAELLFTIERRKLPIQIQPLLQRWQSNPVVEILPLSLHTVLLMQMMTRIPEMHDRLIACEAYRHQATLITVDHQIVAAGVVPTIW